MAAADVPGHDGDMTNTQPHDSGTPGDASDASGTGPTTSATPPSGSSSGGFFDQLRRLGVTRTSDGWIGGVCSGLARRFGMDPAIFRAALIVLLLFGIGFLAYLVAWALLPDEDGSIIAERAIRDGDGWGIFLLVVIGVAVLGTWAGDSRLWAGPVLALAGLAALWYFLVHRPRSSAGAGQTGPAGPQTPPTAQSQPPTPAPGAPVGQPAWATGTASSVGYEPPPAAERPTTGQAEAGGEGSGAYPRRTSSPAGLAALLLVLGAIVVGWGIGVAFANSAGVSATLGGLLGATTAAGLATVLLGLFGRRSFLASLASIALAVSLVSTWGVVRVPTEGFGEQTWRPVAATEQASYTWTMGSATLDLRGMTSAPEQDVITTRVSFGELVIYVPEDITTRIDASAQFGEVSVEGRDGASIRESNSGTRASQSYVFGDGEPELTVDAGTRFGTIHIVTTIDPTFPN